MNLEREALHATFHRLEQRWNVLPPPDNSVWHAYDPLPFWNFLTAVRTAATLTEGRRFLDLGCGVGTKLALMQHLGWQVAGIDRHPPYVAAAAELVPEASVTVGDIMETIRFDADLVYLYRPARADDLEDQVEQHVLAHVEPGTVCFFPFRHDPEVWVI